MKKYSKLLIALLVALIFLGTFVFLWQKSRPKPVVYSEFKPSVSDVVQATIVTGKIEPRNEVNVKPQISGIITEILKEPGDYVNAGEVIAKVKVIPDMSQLSSAEARVRLAAINLKQAQVDFSRVEELFKKELISADEFDKAQQSLKQAKEEKLAADIPVKVGNSVILSNTFNDGTTIASVANMNDLIFRGNIDETEVGKLVVGMPMKITIGALQDLSFDAILEYISPKAVESNGANQFEIKAAVHVLQDSKIRSGYSANAEIVLDKAANVLTIPESAIEFSGDSTFVYLVKKSGKETSYERKLVKTGLSDGVNIEVREGLSEKDVIRGPQIMAEDVKE